MMTRLMIAFALLLLSSIPVAAAPVKVKVSEFKLTGVAGKDELKAALQSMLASRLASDKLHVVGADEPTDLTVVGTYIVFGKVFSIDGQILGSKGKVLGRVFEQGDGDNDVIPAIGRIAGKIADEIGKYSEPAVAQVAESSMSVPVDSKMTATNASVTSAGVVKPEHVALQKAEGDIIKAEKPVGSSDVAMVNQRLEGEMIALAIAKGSDSGKRELIVALDKELRIYRQADGLDLVGSEKGFDSSEKIIGIDLADLDGDGTEELYVTAFNGDQLASRVYLVEDGKFRRIASSLPYYFRGISLKGEGFKIYAQESSVSDYYYGDMYELVKNGNTFSVRNPLKLPRFGNIFNTNMVRGKDGKDLFVVLHPDGYLIVYDDKGENLWKSNDKFGGSETFFSREEVQAMSFTGAREKMKFIEQRITVTKNGDVLVPRNEGNFVIGNSRFFKKSSIYAFAWTGAALEELWHTRVSQNYLPDYAYDNERNELVLLEVVKKADLGSKGASTVTFKKVD